MSLDPAQVQRLNSFIAAMQPRFDEATRMFFDRLAPACPACGSLRPAGNRRSRHEFAASVAMVCKNLGNLDAAGAVFAFASGRCRGAGLRAADVATMHACLLGVLRDMHGPAWTGEREEDVSAGIRECFGRIDVAAAPARRMAA